MMRWGLLALLGLAAPSLLCGQTGFSKGNNALEVTGIFNTYFRYFDNADQEGEYVLELRDARFLLTGENNPNFKFQLMVDFADLMSSDTLDPFLKDAYVNLDLPDKFDLFLGYQLVPFGRNSQVSTFSSVFRRRPAINGGALYYRRNLGVVLRKKMWFDRVNFHAGAFNGSNRLRFDELPFNNMTYVLRADLSLPTKLRFEALDIRHSPLPLVSIGLNGMYTKHERELETELFPLEVDGWKWIAALDLALFYQGLSLQFEATRAWVRRPGSAAGDPAQEFQVNGLHLAANYYLKGITSVLAARLEAYNPDDSRFDENFQVLALAYNYLLDQSQDKLIRLEYRTFLTRGDGSPQSGDVEVNLGFQFRF